MITETNHLLLITGAGASRSFSRGERPMALMSDWATSLCQYLDQEDDGLASALGLHPDMDGYEFEATLGAAAAFFASLEEIDRFADLGASNDRLRSPDVGSARTWLSQVGIRRGRVYAALNKSLWDEFGLKNVDGEAARLAYGDLLSSVGVGHGGPTRLTSATTNYDRVQELAYGLLDLAVDDLARDETPLGSKWVEPGDAVLWSDGGAVVHLHLHGAVGWYRVGDRVRVDPADRRFDEREEPAVLYPDPAKDPGTDAIFTPIWGLLRRALGSATHVLVLGHSLHDPALLEALDDEVSTRIASQGAPAMDRGRLRLAFTYHSEDSNEPDGLITRLREHPQLSSHSCDLSLIKTDFRSGADFSQFRSWMDGAIIGTTPGPQ